MKAVNYAVASTTIIYVWFALLGAFVYGTKLETNVFKNVSEESHKWESYFLRSIFLVVLGCHIPFIFFGGKESTLIIIDEIKRGSISKALAQKLGEFESSAESPLLEQGEDSYNRLVNDTNNQSTVSRKSMAYKEMPRPSYVIGTMANYLGIIFLSIVLNDIALIFEFLSAISISCLAFLFPGAFYLLAEKRFATPEQKEKQAAVRFEARVFCVLGVAIFMVCMASNIAELVLHHSKVALVKETEVPSK